MTKTFFELHDDIVGNTLDSLDTLGEAKPIVVGGLAIQLHASHMSGLLRTTPDVDLLIHENVHFDDFLTDIYPEPSRFLKDIDYQVQPKRGRGNNSLKVMSGQNKKGSEHFLMHWTVFSPFLYEKMLDYIDRQIEFSENVKYSELRKDVKVASLEEIVPLKIQRSIRFGSGDMEAFVGPVYSSLIESARKARCGFLSSMPLQEWKEVIERMQDNIRIKVGYNDSNLMGPYKLTKDIFDLCLAARVISESPSKFDRDRYDLNIARILDRESGSYQVSEHISD